MSSTSARRKQLRTSNKKRKVRHVFSLEEDATLKSLVDKYGEDWELVASKMKNRNPRQVRDRYVNYLAPYVDVSPFTQEEDQRILEKVEEIGPRWLFMRQFFNKRSEIALKNRWLLLERKMRHGLINFSESTQESDDDEHDDVENKENMIDNQLFIEEIHDEKDNFWERIIGGNIINQKEGDSFASFLNI